MRCRGTPGKSGPITPVPACTLLIRSNIVVWLACLVILVVDTRTGAGRGHFDLMIPFCRGIGISPHLDIRRKIDIATVYVGTIFIATGLADHFPGSVVNLLPYRIIQILSSSIGISGTGCLLYIFRRQSKLSCGIHHLFSGGAVPEIFYLRLPFIGNTIERAGAIGRMTGHEIHGALSLVRGHVVQFRVREDFRIGVGKNFNPDGDLPGARAGDPDDGLGQGNAGKENG